MLFESREEELARKLAANEREVTERVTKEVREEDTDREIAHAIILGNDPERIAEVVGVPLARVLSVAEREGLTPKKGS
ncbi:MAG: hypothetical protein II721_06510 [Bacilli bacterium]|nr:hypothetical protein [Bacilli bacterium]